MRATAQAPLLLGFAVLASGCIGDAGEHPPAQLVDGMAVRPPPVELEGVRQPAVLTRAPTRSAASLRPGSRAGSCLASFAGKAHGVVVERVGVRGASLTFADAARRTAYACDRLGERWCAWVAGRLGAGRLRDSHASLSCRSRDHPVGFLWVEPSPAARYVAVEQAGFAEVYPTPPARLPLRVTSSSVDLEAATVRAAVSEHADDGRRLRAYVVEAPVAG